AGFIGPISNPILTKDPRALTEARFLFISDYITTEHPFRGGDFQVYGLEVRAALTDRLSFIADKDGLLSIHPHVGPSETGWLNIAVGLKYAFIRDVENLLLDRGWNGWLYTLAEANWFHWTQGGDRGLPPALGEGDGLINLGTSGVAGNDLVTGAVGLKAIVNRHLDIGTAYEFPLSNRKD